jgi:hypothetical protein
MKRLWMKYLLRRGQIAIVVYGSQVHLLIVKHAGKRLRDKLPISRGLPSMATIY